VTSGEKICPNCGSAEISPLTNKCELCGHVPPGLVAVEPPHSEAIDDLARQELAEEFRLDTFLGRGEDTAVYVARAQHSNRPIVVKVLPRPADRADLDERFRRAIESVAALEHPHIVPVFDSGWTEHLYWYSMEHINGRSLRNFVLQRGAMDLKACLRVVAQIASGLDYAHRRGIVHGALKPENILVDGDGWVHLCDLLVTRTLQPPAPPAPPPEALAEGEPAAPAPPPAPKSHYAAPEDLWTSSADQYALAVVVAECLTGTPLEEPVKDVTEASLRASLPDVPRHVLQAILRALSPRPLDRFTGVLDFLAALQGHATAAPEVRPSASGSTVVLRQTDWEPPGGRLNRRLAIIGSVVAVLVLVFLWQRPRIVRLFRPGSGTPELVTLQPLPSATAKRTPPPQPKPNLPLKPALPGLDEPGRLFVNASPWGQLYVDGQLVGNTPRANIMLLSGPHVIRVLREGYQKYEKLISVQPGQLVRLTDIVLVPNQ
jgi:serine/threonine-protein kinase